MTVVISTNIDGTPDSRARSSPGRSTVDQRGGDGFPLNTKDAKEGEGCEGGRRMRRSTKDTEEHEGCEVRRVSARVSELGRAGNQIEIQSVGQRCVPVTAQMGERDDPAEER